MITKTAYDWILAVGQQVDYWHNLYGGWFANSSAEEYAYEKDSPLGPHEMKLNGVVLTFEMLERLKSLPLPEGLEVPDTSEFWDRLESGEYLCKSAYMIKAEYHDLFTPQQRIAKYVITDWNRQMVMVVSAEQQDRRGTMWLPRRWMEEVEDNG